MLQVMIQYMKQLSSDKSGATAIEYGLIAALIAVIIIGAVSIVGTDLSNMFNTISGSIWLYIGFTGQRFFALAS